MEKTIDKGVVAGASKNSAKTIAPAPKTAKTRTSKRRISAKKTIDSKNGATAKKIAEKPSVKVDKRKLKLEKLKSKTEKAKSKIKAVEVNIHELEKAAQEVEIGLVKLIKAGADKKTKKDLKGQLKKLTKSIKQESKLREKLSKKVAKKAKATEALKKDLSAKAV